MTQDSKRKAPVDGSYDSSSKRPKKKQWIVPKHATRPLAQGSSIEPGDSGVFATCNRNQESKCVGELRDLFDQYVEENYLDPSPAAQPDEGSNDIEAGIEEELASLKRPSSSNLFVHIRLDVQCVIFFKTHSPIDPVDFVRSTCEKAATGTRRTRSILRITPLSLIGKASEKGIEDIARTVLRPHFHNEGAQHLTFAIKPSLRNHGKTTSREEIIKQVATLVGPEHKVDLMNYEKLILVEVYKNICGMSIVGREFERLRRFNLTELNASVSSKVTVASALQE